MKPESGSVTLSGPLDIQVLNTYVNRHFIIGNKHDPIIEGFLIKVQSINVNDRIRIYLRSMDGVLIQRVLRNTRVNNITFSSVAETVGFILTN